MTETLEYRTRLAVGLRTFLRIQVEIREEGQLQSRRASQDEPRTYISKEVDVMERILSVSALTVSTLPVRSLCPLCQTNNHAIAVCNANLPAEEKRARLHYANCCFRCGTRNHIARLCRKSIGLKCGSCPWSHLMILCELSKRARHPRPKNKSPASH
ncbi:hypothetical protein HPB51_000719 [Rhipicephalus microplus]|uniref:CCHC-type domain-containing protein n=1 Tax=Rhipicephalus microplus TaxID=6941 RepID=A0A9J6EQP2_RHIMP|nr:hypothetical protein HPB51_000719 [Rhipicephalus microplus]